MFIFDPTKKTWKRLNMEKDLEMYVKGSTAVLQHCNVTENNVLCYPT